MLSTPVHRCTTALACLLTASISTAQHTGATLDVETTSGMRRIACEVIRTTLRNDDGEPTATMHAFGYLGEDVTQPVTFFWNGGPGLPSAILHTGFAAPRRADLVEGTGLTANPLTLVDRTDLVYVDPIGTGFSRAIAPAKTADFFGVQEDADAAAEFVARVVAEREWTKRPIYLCGESYAGIRVAAMLAPLRERGIAPAGLILISPALDWRTLMPREGSSDWALAGIDFMPTMAALTRVALKQGDRVDRAADRRTVEAALRFALGELLEAAKDGEDVEDLDDGPLRTKLDRFTDGLTRRTLRRRDPYDARLPFRGSRIAGILAGANEKALRTILENSFGIDPNGYRMSARGLTFSWPAPDGRDMADVRAAPMIAAACEGGEGPRVFVAGAWFDTVVPFTIAHRLAAEGAFGNCDVELRNYPAGHMVYVDEAAHRELVADLREWLDRGSR